MSDFEPLATSAPAVFPIGNVLCERCGAVHESGVAHGCDTGVAALFARPHVPAPVTVEERWQALHRDMEIWKRRALACGFRGETADGGVIRAETQTATLKPIGDPSAVETLKGDRDAWQKRAVALGWNECNPTETIVRLGVLDLLSKKLARANATVASLTREVDRLRGRAVAEELSHDTYDEDL